MPSAYIPIFCSFYTELFSWVYYSCFSVLKFLKYCYVDVFKTSVSSSLFLVTGVLNIFMSPLLYVGIFMAYIFSVRLLKFLPVFSIFNVKWAIPLELFHILNRLILQGSFTPELCFTRCSKDASLTDWVKECFVGCNVGFPKKKPHLFIRQWTFTSFSEPSLKTRALFY